MTPAQVLRVPVLPRGGRHGVLARGVNDLGSMQVDRSHATEAPQPRGLRALVAMDYSEPSWLAHAWAIAWASRARCELHYVHVAGSAEAAVEDDRLAELRPTHRMDELGSTIVPHVLIGRPADAIVALAAELGVDVIVMGTHRRRLGSVAAHVVRHAPCPVLCVPPDLSAAPPEAEARPHPVVCAVDFSAHARRATEIAAALARTLGVGLVLVHVVTPPPLPFSEDGAPVAPIVSDLIASAEASLAAWAAAHVRDVAVDTIVTIGSPAPEIVRLARARDGALIVVGTQGHTGLERVLLGSVAEKIVRTAHLPVLAVHLPRRGA